MDSTKRFQLSVLMFLQYAVWGLWGVTLATYLGGLGFTGSQIGWTYNTNQLALILAPLFVGVLTDRLFAIQHVMGVLHLGSAGLMYWCAQQSTPPNFFWGMFAYSLLYFPTLSLANTICFRNMSDPDKHFPGIRVLGTIGWIAAGYAVSLWLGTKQNTLYASAILSAVLGAFCFLLPHTPPVPPKPGERRSMWDALAMLKNPSFAIFMLAAFFVSAATTFYYQQANPFLSGLVLPDSLQKEGAKATLGEWSAMVQTIGQVSEIFFLLALPFIYGKLGIKWTLIVGMAGWALRFWLFGNTGFWPILLLALPMHGICYDFFYVTSQLYVDKQAKPELRSSAQGLLYFITLGIGWLLGNLVTGYILDLNKNPKVDTPLLNYFLPTFLWSKDAAATDNTVRTIGWMGFWNTTAIICAIATAVFLVLFRERKDKPAA
jgi:nucleoside transporter